MDSPTLAARHWVVAHHELLAAGLSPRQIEERAAAGFLHRLHVGVYAVGRPAVSFQGRCLAATLACGEGAAASHITAAALAGFAASGGWIHVSGPRSLKGHRGLIVHRPRSLPAADLAVRHGVPVTSVARTLLDLSAAATVDRVGGWIQEAVVQRCFDEHDALAVCRRHPHHRGRRRLEAALALEVAPPTRSGLEKAFLALVRRAGLPQPEVNQQLWSGERLEEVDFHWPAWRLVVETDGDRYHATRWRKRKDAAKAERFRAQGWRVWRVPELDITLDPAGLAARLAALGRPDPRDAGAR